MQIVGFLILANALPVTAALALGAHAWYDSDLDWGLETAWDVFAMVWIGQAILAAFIGLLVLGLKLSGQI